MYPAQSRIWFITGASSGFGRFLSEELLKRGERVLATARDLSKVSDLARQYPNSARAFALDVIDPEQIASVTQQAIAAFGHVDVLVNNAGYGVAGAIEEVSEDEFELLFQTNLYGLIRTTRAFLPHFRERRSGHILNFSSIGGLIAAPGWGFYNTTKFAVEGFSESLAAEMKPLGVHVTIIEPGAFRTEFLGRSGKLAALELPDYAQTAGKTRENLRTRSGTQAGDPQKGAEAIISVVGSPNPPLRIILGKAALARFRDRLTSWRKELDTWETLSNGVDFHEATSMPAAPVESPKPVLASTA
jgi:NAD(P)-dependent dehydrogenase (short-subunit alcohol dehydrogenase family)